MGFAQQLPCNARGKINESPTRGNFRDYGIDVRGGNGRANFNLFVRNADGTLACESSIIRYTLSEKQYCEWIEYTTRNNLDAPGVSNEARPVALHCTAIKKAGDGLVFAPPGESVTTTFGRNGFTAVIKGQFTDH